MPRLTDRCAVYLVDPLDPSKVEKRVLGPPLSDDEWELFERSGATVTTLVRSARSFQTGVPQHIEDLNDSLLARRRPRPPNNSSSSSGEWGFGGILLLRCERGGGSSGPWRS